MKVNQVDNRLLISAETEFEEEYLKHTFMQKNIKCFLKFGADLTNMIGLIIEPCEKPITDSIEKEEDENILRLAKISIPKEKVIDMIESLESVAFNSIDHVSAANYPDREVEAKDDLRNKAKELIDALDNEHN